MKQIFFRRRIQVLVVLISIVGFSIIDKEMVYSQVINTNDKYPHPKIIYFHPDSNQYQSLLDEEKDSVVFCSGVITLEPNKTGKLHSTKIYEEIIIPLQGEGQVLINDNIKLDIKYGKIAFIPTHMEHQVVNTGKINFKYIYITTKSKC